jgi:thioredoxin 2
MTDSPTTYLITCPSCKTANRIPAAREGQAGRCGNCQRALPPLYLQPVHLTDRSFDAFTAGYDGPVLAEFWAPW